MTKRNHFMKKIYFNQPIKKKLIILISCIMFISLLLTVIGLQFAFHRYDEQLYVKSAQVLNMSADNIENELENIERVSYTIATDPLIQQYLINLREEQTEYEKHLIRSKITDKVLNLINSESYIEAVYIVDTHGESNIAGKRPRKIPDEITKEIIDQSSKAIGSHIWLDQLESDITLVSAREVRRFQDFSFDHLGTVIIRVDTDKLIRHFMEISQRMEGYFLIMNYEGEPIYSLESEEIGKKIWVDQNDTGYRIETINHRKYFIVQMQSSFSNWTYFNVIPFDRIFRHIQFIKTSVPVLFIILFVSVLAIGLTFAKSITNPLENLAAGMKYIQKGNFSKAKSEILYMSKVHKDEVGDLHKNFLAMTEQIDDLIHANYSKQIMIKETEFKALQAQINPHFLYNTLESINWLAKSNQQTQISNMVESLGYLLRNSMSWKEPLVSIEEELKIVLNYVRIQQYRFEERLNFHIDVDSSLYPYKIPKLTLQPLIENAIHYALEPMIEPCMITITSRKEENSLQLIVRDNGPGMDDDFLEQVREHQVQTRGQGIGLKNIDERIKRLFGEQYGLRIESEVGEGTCIIILLPYDKG
ncbi:sensor histidine kinase [Lederbergia sp. NSJ-179]|uniref:cache domain-containing sensor histidine kinase n=1 Tax=Lederbergia sp. NSJ-179 TaxID=2931402 RepID=UPI001FD3C5F6|nr:sensor histidine kinase [Lederbergia sp. NSJ-179]MCJ7843231.1 sensor histidine kinase [Lederbergia sp. NSJ-179]